MYLYFLSRYYKEKNQKHEWNRDRMNKRRKFKKFLKAQSDLKCVNESDTAGNILVINEQMLILGKKKLKLLDNYDTTKK